MKHPLAWFFILAFILVSLVFLVAPTAILAVQAFYGDNGLTLEYLQGLNTYRYRVALENSVILSVVSALVGVVAGGLIAQVTIRKRSEGKTGLDDALAVEAENAT